MILIAIKYGFLLYAIYFLAKNEYDRLDDTAKEKIKKDIGRIKSKIFKSKEAIKNE